MCENLRHVKLAKLAVPDPRVFSWHLIAAARRLIGHFGHSQKG